MSEIYEFSNGVRLRRSDMVEGQLRRYAAAGNPNLHEPVEEDWLLNSFARERPARPLFLDVGAGVGYYSLLIKKRWPDAAVVAFEALPRHADALEANLALNDLSGSDVTLVRAAVGIARGSAAFIDRGYGSGLAVGSADAGTLTVETRTLGDVLEQLPPVHLMKMDIQGAELEVLTSAGDALVRRGLRHVVIGTHGPAIHSAVVARLVELGYAIALQDPCPPMQPDGLVVAYLPAGA